MRRLFVATAIAILGSIAVAKDDAAPEVPSTGAPSSVLSATRYRIALVVAGFGCAGIIVAALLVVLSLAPSSSRQSTPSQTMPSQRTPSRPAPPPAAGVSEVPLMPFRQVAEIAFVGGYSQAQIKERMDRAMVLYGLPITNENYHHAGSALVALRKENGTAEMAILDYMIRSHVEGVNLSFPEAAAFASVSLVAGDR